MPPVPNASADAPAKLERFDFGNGVVLKMTPEAAAKERARLAAEDEQRAAYGRLVAGQVAADASAIASSSDAATASDVLATVLTKPELVAIAEGRALATGGNKGAIASRIVGEDVAEPAEPAAPEEPAASTDDAGAAAGAPAGAAPDAATAPAETPAS